ncbi:hypothetical protein [Intrasporangium calvum]|uniref:hypothetical protein n=1 Tax=Intrasporangium calvum TaxID=53358 RepID=UPI001F3D3805|nr:hypothetical protein [Intrasporangium calvum]
MAKVVLVTGVSRYLGGLYARRLSAEPGIERILGVDVVPPGTRSVEPSSSALTSATR